MSWGNGNNEYDAQQRERQRQAQITAQAKARAKEMYERQMRDRQGKLVEADGGYSAIGGGINRYGQARPDYLTNRDMDGGLNERFESSMGESYSALRDKAMAEGDSVGAGLQREQAGNAYRFGMGQNAQQQAGQLAQARSNMAMRGGSSTGSRERLAAQGMNNSMLAQQGLGRNLANQNLQISMNDEQMKNQALTSLGGVEQNIQNQNIDRLQSGIDNQNIFSQSMYGEDMSAYAAMKSAKASKPSSCFVADTLFLMENGTEKAIADIKLGDVMDKGGVVSFISHSVADDLYNYKGILVTGNHAVKEDSKFIRVKDSMEAVKVEGKFIVYCLGNENHLMVSRCALFSDFFEHDQNLDLEESLEILNETLD